MLLPSNGCTQVNPWENRLIFSFLMALNPVLSWDKAGFLLLYAGVFRDLANFAKVTWEDNGDWTVICDFAFIYNIFVRRTSQSRKLALFNNDEIFSAMSMLCFNIAWACLFRHLGMPVPLLWSSVSSRFFFDALADSLNKDYKLFNTW